MNTEYLAIKTTVTTTTMHTSQKPNSFKKSQSTYSIQYARLEKLFTDKMQNIYRTPSTNCHHNIIHCNFVFVLNQLFDTKIRTNC